MNFSEKSLEDGRTVMEGMRLRKNNPKNGHKVNEVIVGVRCHVIQGTQSVRVGERISAPFRWADVSGRCQLYETNYTKGCWQLRVYL
ncbi:hypothetical protein RUM44_009506 [Polyplax serrata]|uniref:Uncharacterized protein n=1 Tax=Polyplax serrata TaxID=468196 RepID=A0ABR1ASV5_POLSC